MKKHKPDIHTKFSYLIMGLLCIFCVVGSGYILYTTQSVLALLFLLTGLSGFFSLWQAYYTILKKQLQEMTTEIEYWRSEAVRLEKELDEARNMFRCSKISSKRRSNW